jgi:hypothetical protein
LIVHGVAVEVDSLSHRSWLGVLENGLGFFPDDVELEVMEKCTIHRDVSLVAELVWTRRRTSDGVLADFARQMVSDDVVWKVVGFCFCLVTWIEAAFWKTHVKLSMNRHVGMSDAILRCATGLFRGASKDRSVIHLEISLAHVHWAHDCTAP